MEYNEQLIIEIYIFLQEKGIIPKSKKTDDIENKLYHKVAQLVQDKIISIADESELDDLISDALTANEINGFIAGIYLLKNIFGKFI